MNLQGEVIAKLSVVEAVAISGGVIDSIVKEIASLTRNDNALNLFNYFLCRSIIMYKRIIWIFKLVWHPIFLFI